MSIRKMHTDEIDIDTNLVGKLLKEQFPDWSNLPLQVIRPEGTDNAMYKLGDDKEKILSMKICLIFTKLPSI